jgi:hypothetical protein
VIGSSVKSSESLKSDDDDVEGQLRRLLASMARVSCVGCHGGSVSPTAIVLHDGRRDTCFGFRPVSR